MATSPEYLRLATSSTRTLADTVLDCIADAALVVDARHRHLPIVLANEAARSAFSADADSSALIETPLQRRLTPVSSALIEAALADPLSSTELVITWALKDRLKSLSTQIKALPSAAGARLVLLTFRPDGAAADEAGSDGVAAIAAAASDPEDRKLVALTEHARDIITIAAADGTVQYASGGVRNSLGYTSAERQSNNVFDYVHPDDLDELRARYQQLVDGTIGGFSYEFRVKHKDGGYRWLEASYSRAFDNPLIGGVVINARDVTERKAAQLHMAQREEVFRLASEAVDGIIYEWDLVTGVARRSGAILDLLGLEPDEFEPSTDAWRERMHPLDIDSARRAVNLALLSGRGWTTSYRMRDVRGRYRSFLDRGLIQRNALGDPVRAIGCCVDVTEIRRMTDLVTETQQAANIGGWEYSYLTQELTWTEEMYCIYEANEAEFVLTWQSMLARCTPESLQLFQAAFERSHSSGGQIDLELEITTLKSRRIWVRLIAHFEMLDGRPARAFGSVQNVQAQRLARLELESSTSWLKLSMNMAHMHAWRWDRARDAFEFAIIDGQEPHLPSVFPSMKRMLMRVHPGDRPAVSRAIDNAFAYRTEVQKEFRLEARSGRYRWYAAIARPVFDAGGVPRGLVGVIQDVTARRDSETRLRRSEELLRVTTANAADTLILVDTAMRVRFINKSLEGRTIQQIIGRDIELLLPPAARASVLEKLRHLVQTGEAATYEFAAAAGVAAEGEALTYYENRAVLVRDEGIGTCISISMRDVTERKRLEQEIIEVSGRERRSIGRDLHDGLGQELTGVALMLRGLAAKVRSKCPEATEWVDEIVVLVNQSIENARGLARGLLPVRTETGGLTTALRELASRSRDLYGLEVIFRPKIGPELTLDETDSSHLYRIAQEALTNAARHGRASKVSIFLRVSPRAFLLRISDNGEGFRPPTSPYTGMGLKIMKYRAARIGARFEIAPNEPRGTVVQVSGEQPLTSTEGTEGRHVEESK